MKKLSYLIFALSFGLLSVVCVGSAFAYEDSDTDLSTSLSTLSESVSDLSADSNFESDVKSSVDDVVSGFKKETESKISSLKSDVEGVKKSVDSSLDAKDVSKSDLDFLSNKMEELEQYDRNGWHYEPPAAGTATGMDIARAAVDLATSAQPEPEYTDPSDEHAAYYVEIHDRVLAGEDYRACSCVTSTAIHWSGADPDFPRNTSAIVHAYCANSSKWQLVGHGPDKSEMKPGDIFTSDYHTYMYVGNEVVRERFPFSDADVYTGGNQLPYLYWDEYSNRNYDVYRFVG